MLRFLGPKLFVPWYCLKMEDILYGISAFRYHRTPPRARALLPRVLMPSEDSCRSSFRKHPLFAEITGFPVHLMVGSRANRTNAVSVAAHLMTGPLPFGSVAETELGIFVSSPMLTLFQLAQTLSEVQLVMAMYEFCGTFTVFKPTARIGELLDSSALALKLVDGWERVHGSDGRPSDLWKRPPLVEIEELRKFAFEMRSKRNGLKFLKAAELVTGIVASPFEAQLSMLLAAPRRMGGEGLSSFSNNARILLSSRARRLAGKTSCYADLLFEGHDGQSPVIVECQGRVVHGPIDAVMSDSDRTTALQEMGYDVVLVTYGQILDSKCFDTLRRLLFRKLGLLYVDKTRGQVAAESELRRNLFIDWSTLGV